jgi:hypothetical protein
MKLILKIGCLLFVVGAVALAEPKKPASSDEAARTAAIKLWKSLIDEQQKLALRDFDAKERHDEIFPPTDRKSLPVSKLSAEQKALLDDAIAGMTSEYGASRCQDIAKQSPEKDRYLTFYGVPEADKSFAWRIALHHLTLLYAEFGKDKVNEFGPVLLGGNPVNQIWDEEEKIALELRAALSDDDYKKLAGTGGSGAAIGDKGMKIGDLPEKPRELAKKLLEQRLAVFSADRRKILDDLIKRDGGVESLRFAMWGDASKSEAKGGNYSWKIGGESVLFDWQTAGMNHVHMTVRGKAKS